MKATTLVIALVMTLVVSCDSTKNTAADAATPTQDTVKQEVNEKLVQAGYTTGIVQLSKAEGDCAVKIICDNGAVYDPINLEESYKKEGSRVYFRFRPLRMMNRCTDASPVNISEILTDK